MEVKIEASSLPKNKSDGFSFLPNESDVESFRPWILSNLKDILQQCSSSLSDELPSKPVLICVLQRIELLVNSLERKLEAERWSENEKSQDSLEHGNRKNSDSLIHANDKNTNLENAKENSEKLHYANEASNCPSRETEKTDDESPEYADESDYHGKSNHDFEDKELERNLPNPKKQSPTSTFLQAQITTGIPSRLCDACGKSFTSEHQLKRHKKTVHHDKTFPCDVCDKKFKEPHKVIRHKEATHGSSKLPCQFCGKSFPHSENLKKHIQSLHSGPRLKHCCDLCGKDFLSLISLQNHKDSVHFQKKHRCQVPGCEKEFTQSQRLRKHVVMVHEGKVDKFDCPSCDFASSWKESLKIHINSVHQNRKISCKTCGKVFSRRTSLRTHVISAHLGKRFDCSICAKSFSQSGTLAAHHRSVHGNLVELSNA